MGKKVDSEYRPACMPSKATLQKYRKACDEAMEQAAREADEHPEYYGLLDFDDAQDWLEELDEKGMMHPMGFPRDEFATNDIEDAIAARPVPFNTPRRNDPSKAGKRRLMVEDWPLILKAFGSACAYCGLPDKLQMEHVQPVSSGGRHIWQNVVPACGPCNMSKRAKPLTDWLASRGTPFFEAAIKRIAEGQRRVLELRAKRITSESATA